MENAYTFLSSEGIDASWMTPEQAAAHAAEVKRQKQLTTPQALPPKEARARSKENIIQTGAAAANALKQLAAGVVDTAAAAPWDIMGAATGLVEGPLRATGVLDPDIDPEDSLTLRLQNRAQKGRDLSDRAFGKPTNTGEQILRQDIGGPLQELTELAGTGIETVYDQLRELGEPLRTPKKAPVVTHNMPDFSPKFAPADEEEDQAIKDLRQFVIGEKIPEPTDTDQVLETLAGPVKIGRQEWAALGIGALTTLGLMWAPNVMNTLRTVKPPKPRPMYDVPDAAPDTLGGSNRLDLARTYDDANAGIMRYAEAIGMPKTVVDDLEKAFEVHSRSAARQLADAAIYTGDMTVAGLRYKAPPIHKLKMLDTPDARRYLHLRYLMDEIQIGRNMRLNPNNSNVQAAVAHMQSRPRAMVQGMTEADLLAQMNALERANPQLRQVANEYRANVRELRKFMASGEYAIMTKRDQKAMNIAYPNEIPYKDRALDEAVDQGDPFMSLMVDVRHNIRQRLDNEARGQYVDAMRRHNPRAMRRITKRQYDENPSWRKNTVILQRRGRTEYYTTDPLVADILKIDPYYYRDNPLVPMRNLFEMTTTGSLAPWFAITGAIRAYRQGKINAPDGFTGPSILGTISAVPEQLLPQLAKVMADSIERGSMGRLSAIAPNLTNQLGNIAANIYDKSLFAQAQRLGGVNSSVIFREVDDATANLTKIAKRGTTPQHRMLRGLTGLLGGTWQTYKTGLNAVHSAPMYSFLKRNWDVITDKDELIRQARQFAGDPHTSGQGWTGQGERARPVRSLAGELSDGLYDTTADVATAGLRKATEVGRVAIPWYNYTVAGMKQLGKAYLANPNKFVARAWLYGGLPSAMIYFYNHALSQTEEAKANGWDYNERARGQYGYLMNDSIGIPGKPPEQSSQIPRYHEFSIVSALTTAWLDHMFREQDFTTAEDMANIFDQWIDSTLAPPVPPIMAAGVAWTGKEPPMGIFGGGDTYERDREPFIDDNLPAWMNTVPRALAGGAATVLGSMALAYANTEEGTLEAVQNALKQGGKDVLSRTPIVRDLLGFDARRSSDTQIGDAAYESQEFIRNIAEFYKKYSVNEGRINVDPQSERGNAAAAAQLQKYGEDPDTGMVPPDYTGVLPRIPDNPLYLGLMDSFYKSFAKDTGGDMEGFLSLWERAGNLNGKLTPLYKVDAGNMSRWKAEMEAQPDEVRYLRDHGVDYTNPIAVRNFYVEERQKLLRVIVKTIREGEKMMTDRVQAFKARGLENVLDPTEANMTPEELELWMALQALKAAGVNATLPDTVTLKDLRPYLADGISRHGN